MAKLILNTQSGLQKLNDNIFGMDTFFTGSDVTAPNCVSAIQGLKVQNINTYGGTTGNWPRVTKPGTTGIGFNSSDPQFPFNFPHVPFKFDVFDNCIQCFVLAGTKNVNTYAPTAGCGSQYYNQQHYNCCSGQVVTPDDLNEQVLWQLQKITDAGLNPVLMILGREQHDHVWDCFFTGKALSNSDSDGFNTKINSYVSRCNALIDYISPLYPNLKFVWDAAPAIDIATNQDNTWNNTILSTGKRIDVVRMYLNWIDFLPDGWLKNDDAGNLALMESGLALVPIWLTDYKTKFPNSQIAVLQFSDTGAMVNDPVHTFFKCLCDVRMYMAINSWDGANGNLIACNAYECFKRLVDFTASKDAYTHFIEYDIIQAIGTLYGKGNQLISGITNNFGTGVNVQAFKDGQGNITMLVTNQNEDGVSSAGVQIDGGHYKNFTRQTWYCDSLMGATLTNETVTENGLNIKPFSINIIQVN